MHHKQKKTWVFFLLILMLLFVVGWYIANFHFQQRFEHVKDDSRAEFDLIAVLVKERLQKGDYQLARRFISDWGSESSEIVSIVLTAKNGFELARYKSEEVAIKHLVEIKEISFSYDGLVTIELHRSLDRFYQNQKSFRLQLLFGYLFVSLIFYYLIRINLRTQEQKYDLEHENKHRREVDKKLQEREKDLAITLDSIGDAVITSDAEGNVTRMNPVAERLTGWQLSDAQGQSIKTIFPIIDALTREPVSNPVEKVLATGETVYLSDHTTLIAKDGVEYHIADSAAPIRNDTDNIQGMVLIFNDVSEQYQLREEIRSSQHLLQSLTDGLKAMVGIMQLDGRIVFINRMPLELTGVSRSEVLGKPLWSCDWFSSNGEAVNNVKTLCLQGSKGKTVTQDIQFQARKNIIWIEMVVYPVLDIEGNVIQVVFEGVDITGRKETEELQKNYQLELEQQVQERTAELEKKATELARATRLKSEFLANMSHELRTPMNSIVGFTKQVIKKSADTLEERQLNNLRTVERNAYHLLDLINGLLDLAKIEAGKMEAHADSFELSVLIKEVFNLMFSMLHGKSVELKTDLPVEEIYLHTDSVKLKQILINLISNAIKFTEQGSITVSARLQNREPEPQVIIHVTDTGVGIDEDALHYIFEAFRQVDGTLARKVGGTGLGLNIVCNFIKLLRGSVNVESEKNQGTTFELVLPVNLNYIPTIKAK